MHIKHHQVAVLGRVVHLAKLRAAALALYDHRDAPQRVRASVVARDVAADMRIEDSPWFRADLTQALRSAGWRDVKRAGVRYWKGAKRK